MAGNGKGVSECCTLNAGFAGAVNAPHFALTRDLLIQAWSATQQVPALMPLANRALQTALLQRPFATANAWQCAAVQEKAELRWWATHMVVN